MKEKRIQFDYFWNRGYWDLLPAISLVNYENQFDIQFRFMGLFFEIAFMKKEPLSSTKYTKYVYEEWDTKCDECGMIDFCTANDLVHECTSLKDSRRHYIVNRGGLCPGFVKKEMLDEL